MSNRIDIEKVRTWALERHEELEAELAEVKPREVDTRTASYAEIIASVDEVAHVSGQIAMLSEVENVIGLEDVAKQ